MDTSTFLIRLTDLSENTAPRLPVALCLDVSGSMSGEPLEALNRGIAAFFDSLRANPLASRSAWVSMNGSASSAATRKNSAVQGSPSTATKGGSVSTSPSCPKTTPAGSRSTSKTSRKATMRFT